MASWPVHRISPAKPTYRAPFFSLWSRDRGKPVNSRVEETLWQLFSPLVSSWSPAAALPFHFSRHSKSFIIQSLYSLLLAHIDVCYLKPKEFQQVHWWTERKGIYLHKMICMRGRKEPRHKKRERTGEAGPANPRDSCLSSECSKRSCKQMMKPLFYKGSLLKKQSFCVQVTKYRTGQSLLPVLWGMQPSRGTFWVPGNTELLWHPRLDGWGSLKDGILGTILRVITMDTSSMGEERDPPQMAQWATNSIVGRWSEHGKKTSWMPLGNCSGQTGLQYTHWGIPKITEWDLNGGTQGSETWRCEINSAKCGLSPSIGPHCNPQDRETWGNWSSWY